MPNQHLAAEAYRQALQASGKSIYDVISPADPHLWIPTQALESLLNEKLSGLNVAGLPNRTKSKIVKSAVCEAMGYPVPTTFARVKPRFPGQQLEVHVQKALNLQLYNTSTPLELHRYALIEQCRDGSLGRTRVVSAQELLQQATGTVTQKYQARLAAGSLDACLFTEPADTTALAAHTRPTVELTGWHNPTAPACCGELLSLTALAQRLANLVGATFQDPGADQERKRGEALHRLVCEQLGYFAFGDLGVFPDIPHQLLEIKLQTSRTIDLGVCAPDSETSLNMAKIGDHAPRHCDVRYALFFAETNGSLVKITHLILTTGQAFFTVFKRCEGLQVNAKQQISLGQDFFAKASAPDRLHAARCAAPASAIPPLPAATYQQLSLW